MSRDERFGRGDPARGPSSFRELAASGRHGFEDRAQARYVERHAPLIDALQDAGHSIVFSTRTLRGEGGTSTRVTMWCNTCWKKHRRVVHRWWGLSPDRPCG